MKMKKVLAAAIPVMLLYGCATEKTAVDKTIKNAESQPVSKKEKVSKEEYVQKITDLTKEFDSLFGEFQKLALVEEKTSKDKEKIYKKLDEVQKVINKLLAIEAPSEYKDAQENVDQSMKHFTKAIKLIKEGYSKRDKDIAEKSKDELYEADKYWDKFQSSIADEVKVGDGTITAKDLDELDKKAGIDMSQVRQNLSRNGKELVGTWGFEKEGTFTVSLILKKDGTFESYGKGQYPSKTDYIKGKWKYESDRYTIMLHLTEALVGGQKTTIPRTDIPLQIQNFGEGKIQLFDPESFQTIRYAKQK